MDNPRPPKGYFKDMLPQIKRQYPKRPAGVYDRIIAGIFWKLPENKRQEIINRYDKVKVNPKTELLECPSCHAKNPVSRAGVFLKCSNCKKNLVSVKVKHK